MGRTEAVPSAAAPETPGVCKTHCLRGARGVEAGLQGHAGLEGCEPLSRADVVNEAGASLRREGLGGRALRGGSEARPGAHDGPARSAWLAPLWPVSGSSCGLLGCGYNYTAGPLVESPGVDCSPGSGAEGTFSGPGGGDHRPLCWPRWTQSRCADSGVFAAAGPPRGAPLAACGSLCGSFLEGCPCYRGASELGVLQPVCGLLRGCTKGWAPQNKEGLVKRSVCSLSHPGQREAFETLSVAQ